MNFNKCPDLSRFFCETLPTQDIENTKEDVYFLTRTRI